jgi:hypothetical protein
MASNKEDRLASVAVQDWDKNKKILSQDITLPKVKVEELRARETDDTELT